MITVAVLTAAFAWPAQPATAALTMPVAPARTVATAAACRRAHHPVIVRFSRARWPHIADHIADVRERYPLVLHIDRAGADQRRRESLRGIPTRPGYDRDEVPPAVAREGGDGIPGPGRPADVRYVASGENRSAGGYLGGRLRRYCDRSPFKMLTGR